MINNLITLVLCISIASVAYWLGARPIESDEIHVNNKESAQKVVEEVSQGDVKEQMDALELEQVKINTTIGELAVDIKFLLENISKKKQKILEDDDESEQDSLSDAALGKHIEDNLDDQFVDDEKTAMVLSQTEESLKKIPGVEVTELRCGTGVCKAKFVRVDGKRPNIDSMWGEPPLMHEGLTEQQDDGSIVLYFTDGEASLDEIRVGMVD